MRFTLLDLYCFSIGIAAIIGVVRFNRINPAYYPFVYLCWLAFTNEIISYLLLYTGQYNSLNNNIYVLFESFLICWQFRKWGLLSNKKLFLSLLTLFLLAWFIEAFFIKGIKYTITYFRIFYSFIVVLMSLQIVSHILLRERSPLLRNSIFLICLGFIIYFTFKILVGIFWLWGLNTNDTFVSNMIWILVYLNVFTNLIYALAVSWMPRRLQFTMPL